LFVKGYYVGYSDIKQINKNLDTGSGPGPQWAKILDRRIGILKTVVKGTVA